ncbi:MAG: phage virion morphogenesis protein, partial [Nitrososphaera sp.]|nr:phage virion morphogenesis protein [Nitrososphaera sp.]
QSGGGKIIGTVGTNVKYAAIHEFGGLIHVPEIIPVRAKALHFFMHGREIFAKRVRAHTIRMPARSFLCSSLLEMEPQAGEMFADRIQKVLSGSQ